MLLCKYYLPFSDTTSTFRCSNCDQMYSLIKVISLGEAKVNERKKSFQLSCIASWLPPSSVAKSSQPQRQRSQPMLQAAMDSLRFSTANPTGTG